MSVSAEAEGCSPIAQTYREDRDFVAVKNTIAKSIAIGNPADGVYALEVAKLMAVLNQSMMQN